MTADFRSVYATLIDEWLGTSSEKVLGARLRGAPFPGQKHKIRLF